MTIDESNVLWEERKHMIRAINAHSARIEQEEAEYEKRQRVIAIEKKREKTFKTITRTSTALLLTMVAWYGIANAQLHEKYGAAESAGYSPTRGNDTGYFLEGEFVSEFEATIKEMPEVINSLFSTLGDAINKGK